jgi:hypothetical protein
MKRAFVFSLILALLASVLAASPTVEPVGANWSHVVPPVYYDNLSLFSPANVTYRTTQISLVFTRVVSVRVPLNAFYILDGEEGMRVGDVKVDIFPVRTASRVLQSAHYILPGEEYKAWLAAEYFPEFTEYTLEYNVSLPKLADGSHKLIIAKGQWEMNMPYFLSKTVSEFSEKGSLSILDTVYFSVKLSPPQISVFLPENATGDEASLQLGLSIVEEASWVSWLGYSLDGKGNVSISKDSLVQLARVNGKYVYCDGMFSLSGLSAGVHRVSVYGENLDGLTGVASCVFTADEDGGLVPGSFTVSQEADLTTGNSTVSQEATSGELASTLFPAPTTVVAATMLASVAVVSFGLVAYFLRRKKRRPP